MIIKTGTFMPYELTKEETYRHLVSRCLGLKNSLRLIERTRGHLEVRCPLAGDYLDIFGTEYEIEWLNKCLTRHKWYR